jgi:hypothetical protein
MKNTLTKIMQDLNFNYLIHSLGIEPAKKEVRQDDLFNTWMRDKVKSVHYSDNEAMTKAYQIINNKI